MSYLLYCIFHNTLRPEIEVPAGVDGQPVLLVKHEPLCAVLSELTEPNSPPDISRILAYERVVESFYQNLTVIPMRYGCQAADPSHVVSLLKNNCIEYSTLLHQLEGLTEMGIQILLKDSGMADESNSTAVSPQFFIPGSSGSDYLAAKRQYYLRTDSGARRQSKLVETLCHSLSSLFIEFKVESRSLSRGRLQSLYFLLPRNSVESFRRATQRFLKNRTARVLLSGPWPPYNFVKIPQKNCWVS